MSIKLKRLKNNGFTVVETLIVLAVTGVLFMSTSLLIQGQIERYRYRDSIYRTQQTLQSAINNTQNGYFSELNSAQSVDGSSIDTLGSKCGFSGNGIGNSESCVIAGRRVMLCTNNVADTSLDACLEGNDKIRIETILLSKTNAEKVGGPLCNNTASDECFYVTTDVIQLPGGLTTGKVYFANTTGGVGDDFGKVSTGYNVMFSNYGKDVSAQQGTVLKDRWGTSNLEFINGGRGQTVCFEGQRNGSITFGKAGSLTIETNMEDINC